MREEVVELKKEVEEVKKVIEKESTAMEILSDYKKQSKRQFIIILVILGMWFATIGYLVYTLNDIGTVEETITQEVSQDNSNGDNNFIGGSGEITNGITKNKANSNN